MEKTTLLKLKKEILECNNLERLYALSINLRHFVTIFNYKLNEEGIDEEEAKDIRNSLSLADAYLKVISWKLTALKQENQNDQIQILLSNKEPLLAAFEEGFKKYLEDYSTSQKLKEENSKLKAVLNEYRMKSYKKMTFEERELRKIKDSAYKLYNQISEIIDDDEEKREEPFGEQAD